MSEFAEFHAELRSVAGDLLAKDRTVEWPALVDAGWVGLEVPEQFGGAGATFAETAVLCEEMGRAASTNSFLGSAVLAVGTLNALPPSESRDQLLSDVASGGVRVAVALDDMDFVPDADGADRVLVVAENGVTVATHTATTTPVVDETRRLAHVTPTGGETLQFDGDPSAAIQRLRDRAAVAIACDSIGVSEAMLDATVGYVKVREQFGRPIGSFQAVKHACADMLVSINVSRQLVTAAVQAIAEDQDATVAAAMAKSHACGAAVDIAGKAMQLHGGIGYTWESGIHVYLKRAALNRSLFGSPAAHRRELAKRYKQ